LSDAKTGTNSQATLDAGRSLGKQGAVWRCHVHSTTSQIRSPTGCLPPVAARGVNGSIFRAPCEPECPAAAIFPNTVPGNAGWLELNARYASVWPNITVKRSPPADANAFDGVPNKFERYFSEIPGRGD